MKRMTTAAVTCAAAALLAASLTGCSGSTTKAAGSQPSSGGSSGGAAATASATPVSTASVAQATVATKSAGKLGTILVNGRGRTLYLFAADTSKNSTCTGACAAAWPPLLTSGSAVAGTGAKQNLLSTTTRSGGAKQVTYDNHPLYLFAGDAASGQTNGQGLTQFGALWWVVNPSGKQVTTK